MELSAISLNVLTFYWNISAIFGLIYFHIFLDWVCFSNCFIEAIGCESTSAKILTFCEFTPGFTRRFQPDKPTTIGQAAIALTSGEAADLVAEDMARIEAEAMATQAVVADIANEVRALRENNGNSEDEVNVEKAKREEAEKLINELRVELEQVKVERDAERYSYLKGRATVDSEKGILQLLRQQVDQQAQELSALQAQVAGEKERFEKLRLEREAELEAVSHLRADLEVEKKALTLVRFAIILFTKAACDSEVDNLKINKKSSLLC